MRRRFRDQDVVIDVGFTILEENILPLPSMQNMLQNGLDSSIRGLYVSLGSGHPRLMM